jgi:hypothetical protein
MAGPTSQSQMHLVGAWLTSGPSRHQSLSLSLSLPLSLPLSPSLSLSLSLNLTDATEQHRASRHKEEANT